MGECPCRSVRASVWLCGITREGSLAQYLESRHRRPGGRPRRCDSSALWYHQRRGFALQSDTTIATATHAKRRRHQAEWARDSGVDRAPGGRQFQRGIRRGARTSLGGGRRGAARWGGRFCVKLEREQRQRGREQQQQQEKERQQGRAPSGPRRRWQQPPAVNQLRLSRRHGRVAGGAAAAASGQGGERRERAGRRPHAGH
mmetsp:Transcript_20591/g.55387  ORF Transcript_20591/g.55387 Transcript_20591/m.55387 type:complete len:201 (-) Transcript_20591:1742-2344(-)